MFLGRSFELRLLCRFQFAKFILFYTIKYVFLNELIKKNKTKELLLHIRFKSLIRESYSFIKRISAKKL